jgi:hypothetical protein
MKQTRNCKRICSNFQMKITTIKLCINRTIKMLFKVKIYNNKNKKMNKIKNLQWAIEIIINKNYNKMKIKN